jgi:hypothetical protein
VFPDTAAIKPGDIVNVRVESATGHSLAGVIV